MSILRLSCRLLSGREVVVNVALVKRIVMLVFHCWYTRFEKAAHLCISGNEYINGCGVCGLGSRV